MGLGDQRFQQQHQNQHQHQHQQHERSYDDAPTERATQVQARMSTGGDTRVAAAGEELLAVATGSIQQAQSQKQKQNKISAGQSLALMAGKEGVTPLIAARTQQLELAVRDAPLTFQLHLGVKVIIV
jgi:hypothetical protein